MKLDETIGKTVALVMMGIDESVEDDWVVVKGHIEADGDSLMFIHGGTPDRFPLPDDALDRISPTTSDTREILLDADLHLFLSVGPKPDDEENNDYIKTGLKWPADRE
ncbi:MAG TPA: hypothetical protein PKE26_16050 [Kiritimatiellia bacterium]|nr:hypothetical protein [Saprospiraceae bacterium]HMP00610.1 hypothetical protein [Kiritimatiellia bacterium]